MRQHKPESPDPGAAHTLIVRLRREPGSAAWRARLIDVHSGEAAALNIAPNQGDDIVPFATALAAAIEQLLRSKRTKET